MSRPETRFSEPRFSEILNSIGGLSNSKVLNLESYIESQMHKKDSTFKMNLKF